MNLYSFWKKNKIILQLSYSLWISPVIELRVTQYHTLASLFFQVISYPRKRCSAQLETRWIRSASAVHQFFTVRTDCLVNSWINGNSNFRELRFRTLKNSSKRSHTFRNIAMRSYASIVMLPQRWSKFRNLGNFHVSVLMRLFPF